MIGERQNSLNLNLQLLIYSCLIFFAPGWSNWTLVAVHHLHHLSYLIKPKFRYYIYNPTTNQLLMFPKNNHFDRSFAAIMTFDPSKSPHYWVFLCSMSKTPQVRFPMTKQFYIYSSETRTWRLAIRSTFYFSSGWQIFTR